MINRLVAGALLMATMLTTTGSVAGPLEDASAVRSRWADAVNAGDVDGMVAVFTNDVLFFGASAPLFKGREAVRAYLSSRPSGLKVKVGEHSVVAIEPNVLLSSGLVEFSAPGRPAEPVRLTLAIVKQGDQWLIAQTHTSPVPSR